MRTSPYFFDLLSIKEISAGLKRDSTIFVKCYSFFRGVILREKTHHSNPDLKRGGFFGDKVSPVGNPQSRLCGESNSANSGNVISVICSYIYLY